MRLLRPLAAIVIFCAIPSLLSAQWLEHATPKDQKLSSPKKKVKWFYDQRNSGGEMPADAYAKAVVKASAMQRSLPNGLNAATQNWKLIGPANITPGSGGYHAGRVLTIAVSPTDENIAYAGSANGGIWKTLNKGRTWMPLTDNAMSLAVGAIAVDPQDPQILFAGTGEYAEGVGSYYGAGLMRSMDGGKTWKNIGLMNVGAFTQIIVHPKNPLRLYASGGKSGGGIFRSDDRGNTWRKLANGLPSSGASDLALSVNGTNDVLWAGMPGVGIFLSMDGGDSWTLKQNWLEMRRIHLDVSPTDWKKVVTIVSKNDGSIQAAEKSLDGGETWEDIYAIDGDIFGSNLQGWYDIYIKMNPSNPDNIIMGGISIWSSEDGGQNWSDIGQAYKEGGIHPDQHNAAFAPSNNDVVYFTNDGGVWMSDDRGSTIQSYRDDLAITQFYGITIDQTTDDLTYGGTQDNGTLAGSSTEDWSLVSGGDGSFVQVDESDPSRIFYVRPGDGNTLAPIRLDGDGETWLGNGIRADTVSWLKPLVYDSKNNRLYFGTTNLYVSTSRGNTWQRRKQIAFGGNTITYIDPFGDGSHLLLGTSSGKVFYTTDQGATFTERTKGLPGRWVTSVKFSPGSKTTLYASLSGFGGGHVYRSSDAGANWVDVSSNLPDVPVNELLIDPDNPKSLYVATDVGVFFSPDAGALWMPYGNGLPNVAVFDMDIHRTKRVLRAGSHGRSIWEIPLFEQTAGIIAPTVGTTWVNGQPGFVSWRGLPTGEATVQLSLDGGDTFTDIGKSGGNRLDFSKIPFVPSTNAVVRVFMGADTLRTGLFQIQQLRAGMISHVVSQQPLYMYDIAFDEEENVLWTTHFDVSSTKIYKIHPDNGEQLGSIDLGAGKFGLTGITFDNETKTLWVHSARDAEKTSYVYNVSRTGQVLSSFLSPAVYGTGILVQGDTLLLVDRNPDGVGNRIFKVDKNTPEILYYDMYVTRQSPFGGRCLAWDPEKKQLLHTWTDFQGSDQTARLYDSYLTWLDPSSGEEKSYSYIQEATNQGTNVRGLEHDPRNGGTTLWMTLLGSGATSSSIIKVNLKDSPLTSSVKSGSPVSALGSLEQNHPNPFNPTTTVPFTLAKAGNVQIVITDELGRDIMTTTRRFLGAGEASETIDASRLSSGTYTYTLRVDGIRIDSKRMTLVK
jgi:photosystem II stability/assembly factor-like uncharacterized protein